MTSARLIRWCFKPAVFAASLFPAVYLSLQVAKALGYLSWDFVANLSPNPLSDVTNGTGDWAIRFICITLAITPLRRITGLNEIVRFRRMVGLFAFFYGTLHFLTYVLLDRVAGLDAPNGYFTWSVLRALVVSIASDVYKRPYITVGFTAFVLMIPLAFTSTAGWIRRLGGKRWQLLHRLIYLTGIGAVVHYWWLVKADIRLPLMYGTIVAVLLGFRLYRARGRRRVVNARTATAQS